MWKNYLTIAYRNLKRSKGYAAINIGGLAVGLAACLLIGLWVQHQLSYDEFHEKADRIYRIIEWQEQSGRGTRRLAATAAPVGPALVRTFPEVVNTVRVLRLGALTIGRGDTRFYDRNYLITGPSFFELFDFKMLRGDPQMALREPHSIVLTEERAAAYFGEANPIGKTLSVEVLGDFTVTGVVRVPGNSHMNFSLLMSWATITGMGLPLESWDATGILTYVLLDKGHSAEALEAKLPGFIRRNVGRKATQTRTFHLQPLTDIHFGSDQIENLYFSPSGEMVYVYIFSAIALFIVLIACINYMNLATARSTRRAREVGVRKVAGARRTQLIGQFMGEAVLLTLVATAGALLIARGALPFFSELAGKELALGYGYRFPLLLIGLALIVGLAAGSYPALYLSRFQPSEVLQGSSRTGGGVLHLRQGLVVFQFVLSIGMIAATLVVARQLDYMQEKQLGFKEEHLITIDINSEKVRNSRKAIKTEFAKVPTVRSVAVSSRVPGDWKGIPRIEVAQSNTPASATTQMHFLGVGEDFLDTYQIDLLKGRGFSEQRTADSTAVLINETAARMLGFDNPVGKRIHIPTVIYGGIPEEVSFQGHIIGVVGDFHFQPLHQKIGPLVLGYRSNPIQEIDYFTMRISGQNVPHTLRRLRAVGARFDPSRPVEVSFLDKKWSEFYRTERRIGRLFAIFAGLAIVIACLGLFGLAAYAAERRTKEIGIRKVLGASMPSIVALLSKDFLKLVLVAFVIAAPLAYFVMRRWLQDFAYHIDLGPWLFVGAGGAALVIALAAVSYQAVKAALADPVDALRYE